PPISFSPIPVHLVSCRQHMSIPLLFIMSITFPSLPLIDPTLILPIVNLLSSSAVANFSPPTSFASDGAPLFRDPRICGTRGRVVCSILLCIHGVLALFIQSSHLFLGQPLPLFPSILPYIATYGNLSALILSTCPKYFNCVCIRVILIWLEF